MKATFTAEHYKMIWAEMIKPTIGEHYRNLEAELAKEIEIYETAGISEQALETIRKMKAQEIADDCKAMLIEDMKIAKKIREKRANFGYTTVNQEIQAQHRFAERFEFNCFQLAEFKKKYNLK